MTVKAVICSVALLGALGCGGDGPNFIMWAYACDQMTCGDKSTTVPLTESCDDAHYTTEQVAQAASDTCFQVLVNLGCSPDQVFCHCTAARTDQVCDTPDI